MKIKNKSELSQIFGVSLNTIDAWLRKGMPHKISKKGRYEFDVETIIKWRESLLKVSDDEMRKAKIQREVYKAKLCQLQFEKESGLLVYAADVKHAAFESGRMLRDQLLNIPARVSPILAAERDTKKVNEILTKEIRQCIETIAADLIEEGKPQCQN